MNDQELAELVMDALHQGIVAWRYPYNVEPEFSSKFGCFFWGEPIAQADYTELNAIIKATGAKIVHHWRCKRPLCFRPPRDRILLPVRSYFRDEAQYHACRIHEVLHYLEQPWRVGWIGTDHQSELVCEIGTGFLESYLRLPHDEDNTNINKWLPAWKKGIEANPRYLFLAVARAKQAVNYLLDLREQKEAA